MYLKNRLKLVIFRLFVLSLQQSAFLFKVKRLLRIKSSLSFLIYFLAHRNLNPSRPSTVDLGPLSPRKEDLIRKPLCFITYLSLKPQGDDSTERSEVGQPVIQYCFFCVHLVDSQEKDTRARFFFLWSTRHFL